MLPSGEGGGKADPDQPNSDTGSASDGDPNDVGEHERHKPPSTLQRARPLIVACPEMRSNVNLSRIVRAAGCCGVTRLIAAGRGKVDPKIARDAMHCVEVSAHRSLAGPLKKLCEQGFCLVGLEQTSGSVPLADYAFPRQTVLVIGHERKGIEAPILALLDAVVEIPVYGQPHSFNAATATAIAMYEYCRQHPDG